MGEKTELKRLVTFRDAVIKPTVNVPVGCWQVTHCPLRW